MESGAGYFGARVITVRTGHGWSQAQLAQRLSYGQPAVSKVESGKVLASRDFAAACDHAFRTGNLFVDLRRDIAQQGHPTWFQPYVELERIARQILVWEALFVPGILQTETYAREVFRAAHPREGAASIDDKVRARLERREVLAADQPPLLWTVVHEGALRTRVGGREVMRDQLRHLLEATEQYPDLTLQIFPFRAGAPAATPYALLRFPKGFEQRDTLYEEGSQYGRLDDSEPAVEAASGTFDRLRAGAASPEDSAALIRHVLKDTE